MSENHTNKRASQFSQHPQVARFVQLTAQNIDDIQLTIIWNRKSIKSSKKEVAQSHRLAGSQAYGLLTQSSYLLDFMKTVLLVKSVNVIYDPPPHITYKWICWILFLRSFEATTSQHKVTPSLETTNVWWLWFIRRGHHCLSSSFAMKAFHSEPQTLSRLFDRSQDKITSSYFYHTNHIFFE